MIRKGDRNDKGKNDDRDLNKEINEYWMKGSGNKNITENKVAHEKLNDEMENYWKKKAETDKKEAK